MSVFARLYERLEIALWNSLTRKLSSFLVVFLAQLAVLGLVLREHHQVQALLAQGGASAQVADQVSGVLEDTTRLMMGLTVLLFLFIVFMVWYLRYLIVRPLQAMSGLLQDMGKGEGDLTHNLPLMTHDEIRLLSESYPGFSPSCGRSSTAFASSGSTWPPIRPRWPASSGALPPPPRSRTG